MVANRFIRPSQFVTTYGAGSIVRVGETSRIIPNIGSIVQDLETKVSFSRQDGRDKRKLEKFRVEDAKLEAMVRNYLDYDENTDVRIFRLPSNADMEMTDGEKLYNTNLFPRWSICKRHGDEGILTRLENERGNAVIQCPLCKEENLMPHAGVGVRFIRACKNGHMDDIDWHLMAHRGAQCSGMAFSWKEDDDSFRIKCLTCGKDADYRQIKGIERQNAIECSGYFPESERSVDCVFENGEESHAKIILKNASNLRIAHVLSSLLVPPYSDMVYQVLKEHRNIFLMDPEWEKMSKNDVIGKFRKSKLKLGAKFFAILDKAKEDEIRTAIRNISRLEEVKSLSEGRSDEQEFAQLLEASRNGYPKPYTGEPAYFVVDKNRVKDVYSKKFGLKFTITPISTLNVTQVQVGYSREVGTKSDQAIRFSITPTGKLVPTFHMENSVKWFIGSQMHGEGIFLHAGEHDIFEGRKNGEYKLWEGISSTVGDKREKVLTSPGYVWWHSLGHRLINDLSIDSGFQSSAIREKTYVRRNENTGTYEGGVLLYAVQQGGDGTMGGLTGQAENFDRILDRAYERLVNCSNDPICVERGVNVKRRNGSACHACLITSETSCNVRNLFLDRRLIMQGPDIE